MKISGDDTAFWVVVDEIEGRLERLNKDGSFSGLATRLHRLLKELPADFFEQELVSTLGADELEPTLIIRPGPRLNAIAAALRALDFHIEGHIEPLEAA